MSTTFGTLKTEVSKALRDPDRGTFVEVDVEALVNTAVSVVGAIAPMHFQDDIDPVADSLEYTLRSATFAGALTPEIEVSRLELWDSTTVPWTRTMVIPAASAGYAADSQAGWVNWGGQLQLPNWVVDFITGDEGDYSYRVWGYSPYPQMAVDADAFDGSPDLVWAIIAYCRVEGLERLVADRDLFSQWQTRSGVTDISPAGLMNNLSQAREDWRRKSRALTRLRAQV